MGTSPSSVVASLCIVVACACGEDAIDPNAPVTEMDAMDPQDSGGRPAAPCVDGVDCLCDTLLGDSQIAFCEDFEAPSYNAYPAPSSGYTDGHPFALRYNSTNHTEGPCPGCGYNVVAETDGQCDVPGEVDCVLDGNQAFGHHFLPGQTGGIVGETSFDIGRTFGVTLAFKFSENFVDPSVAMKSNEFGARNATCLLGCSTSNAGSRNVPFGWGIIGTLPLAPELLVGKQQQIDVGLSFNVDPRQYEWRGSMRAGDDPDKVIAAPGRWICQQVHFRNWGTANTELRAWIDGKLVLHVRGLDMTGMRGPDGQPSPDLDDPGYMVFNHYYNGGYAGSAPAYRYEDNVVITRAAEPVGCEAIGAKG